MATETTKLTFVEGAAASTPSASRAVIYAKADGLMYSKDDAGVETLMSSGSGSGIAATIFDAKGDLIAASAADTAARLAVISGNGSSLVVASGEATGLKWQLNNLAAATAPTVNEDSGDGYAVGSRWLDTTNDKEYVCLDATGGAAVWKETTVAATTSALTVAAVGSDHAISSTTGTEVTLTPTPTLQAGTYTGRFVIIAQSATTTIGPRFGLNFSGTATLLAAMFSIPSTATGTANGTWDNTAGVPIGNQYEAQAMDAFSTTTPNMGAAGVAVADVNVIGFIDFTIVVTVAGDVELWHSSENASSTTVKAGTGLIIHKIA